MSFSFTEDKTEAMAAFVAELVRQGVTFDTNQEMVNDILVFTVTLTGGY